MSTGGSFARIAHRNKSSGNIYSGRNLPQYTFSRKKFLAKNFIRAKSSWLKTLFAQNIPLQCFYSRKIFLKSAGILFLARNINSWDPRNKTSISGILFLTFKNIRNNIPGLLRNIYSSPGILFLEFRNIIPGAQEYYSWSSGILFLDIFQLLGTFVPGIAQNSRYGLEIFARFAEISHDLLDFSSWFAQNSRYVLKFLGNFVAINTTYLWGIF